MNFDNSAYNSGLVARGSPVVPAQPGFYVLRVEPLFYGDGEDRVFCYECRRAPVIAWRVGDSVVLPVTLDLTIPAGERAHILTPDGNVITPDSRRYLSYGDWWDDMLASAAGKDRRDAHGGDPVEQEEPPLRRRRPQV